MRILFLQGWRSVPGGVKPTFLAAHGHRVFNPQLPDEDFAEAVKIAQAEFDRHRPEVVVGSSRGGAVAMNLRSGDARLVLLCPAWKRHGTVRTVKPGTVILHSRADDVVPFADSEEPWRNRDDEFVDTFTTRGELTAYWESGWQRLFDALSGLSADDLGKTVTIRGEPHSVPLAIQRSLAHCGYHVGQIMLIARILAGENWTTITIPRGGSAGFNQRVWGKGHYRQTSGAGEGR